MTRPARFTQSDVARTVRAVAAAKVQASIVISPDGTIRIEPLHASTAAPAEPVACKREIVL
jgi:hypothetical protein